MWYSQKAKTKQFTNKVARVRGYLEFFIPILLSCFSNLIGLNSSLSTCHFSFNSFCWLRKINNWKINNWALRTAVCPSHIRNLLLIELKCGSRHECQKKEGASFFLELPKSPVNHNPIQLLYSAEIQMRLLLLGKTNILFTWGWNSPNHTMLKKQETIAGQLFCCLWKTNSHEGIEPNSWLD